jgi:hypothetical protein
MQRIGRWIGMVVLFGLPLTAFACSDDPPEGPGDECESDGDPCPSPLVCEAGICQIPPGQPCDPNAADPYCTGDNVCLPTEEGSTSGVCGVPEGGTCDPDAPDPFCAGNLVCAELADGGHACHEPVLVHGMVFDSETEAAIEGAHVIALDDQASAITDVAISDAEGNYELNLPVERQADGTPTSIVFTLRASADGYQTFPGGIRTSLPISTTEAGEAAPGYVIDNALTDIALIALEDTSGLVSISGTVVAGDRSGGVLVVAEDGGGAGLSAISDLSGAYTIFNVPDGSYTVKGYLAQLQLEPATAEVAGSPLEGVDLVESSAALGSISGSINIVNAPGDSASSVVLVVESTFSDTFVRGEVPSGLRSPLSGPPDVTGAFTIEGVPEGRYVVLAAFENDDLVRDPDPGIAGTQIVHIAMPSPGQEITLDESFKVTEALAVVSPGADEPEAVTDPPTFVWADDSGEDYYTVVVYDAYGDLVWEDDNVPRVTGSETVEVEYGGPALEAGMYYQFRATSWSTGGTTGPISNTEDLRGVFYLE